MSTIKDARFDGPFKWQSAVLLLNGCPVTKFDSASAISVVHGFSEPIEVNGLMLTFPCSSDSRLSHFFQVIGNSTNEDGGSVVISSDWHWNDRGVRFMANPVPLRETMTVDYRPPWPWYLEYTLTSFLLASMLVCVGAGGLLRWKARTSLFGCVLLAIIHCVATAGYLSMAFHRQAWLTAAYALIWTSASLVLALAPTFLHEACACLGAAGFLARVISDCVIFRDCWNLAAMPPICEIAVMALGAVLVVARYPRLARVVQELAQDRQAYDAEWMRMLESEGFEATARRSARRLDEIVRRATGAQPRAMSRIKGKRKVRSFAGHIAPIHTRFLSLSLHHFARVHFTPRRMHSLQLRFTPQCNALRQASVSPAGRATTTVGRRGWTAPPHRRLAGVCGSCASVWPAS
jgi:hypothetical protein